MTQHNPEGTDPWARLSVTQHIPQRRTEPQVFMTQLYSYFMEDDNQTAAHATLTLVLQDGKMTTKQLLTLH